MPRRFVNIITVLLALGFLAGNLKAEDKMWCGLLLATKEDKGSKFPVELKEYKEQLKSIFGYNHFELIGEKVQPLGENGDRWLVPSRKFSLQLHSRKQKDGHCYMVDLNLFQEEKMLMHAEAKLGQRSPLFIRGPLYGNGQLILVVLVQ